MWRQSEGHPTQSCPSLAFWGFVLSDPCSAWQRGQAEVRADPESRAAVGSATREHCPLSRAGAAPARGARVRPMPRAPGEAGITPHFIDDNPGT